MREEKHGIATNILLDPNGSLDAERGPSEAIYGVSGPAGPSDQELDATQHSWLRSVAVYA